MKAVQITEIGKPLEQNNFTAPMPKSGEVLIAVKAAGICHSDAHYRAGVSSIGRLPRTPGHEVAGVIESVGEGVTDIAIGDRVCLHYLVACGECSFCKRGIEQFCPDVKMIGKDINGGYAEYIVVPARNVFRLPDSIPFDQAAVMMCSFSTSLHAIRKAKFKAGETVAIFGVGGLGTAAIQIANALGASKVIAVDTNSAKVHAAESLGAIGIDAGKSDPVDVIMSVTDGLGADVALELVGLPVTTSQAVRSLAVQGRAAIAGLADAVTNINMYKDLIGKEREIIGVSDHLPGEIEELIEMVQDGKLKIESAVTNRVPLEADAINKIFDELDSYSGGNIRTVIIPE